jgi:hypothetical protein
VHGVKAYHLQLEWWKPSFGWVLSTEENHVAGVSHSMALAPRTKYRWRVCADADNRDWSGWSEFATL